MNTLIRNLKRYFIFALLLLFLLFLLWLKLIIAPKTSQELALITPVPSPSVPEALLTPTTALLQNPNLLPNAKLNYQYEGVTFSGPESLPFYTYKNMPVLDLGQAKTFAKNFAFVGDPTRQDKDLQGAPTYLWVENTKKLFLGGSFPVIHFYNFTSLIEEKSAPLSHETILGLSKKQLTALAISNVDFNSARFTYYKPLRSDNNSVLQLEEQNDESGAGFVGIGLTYNLSGYTVITDIPKNKPIFLLFNNRGDLYELLVFLFPQEILSSYDMKIVLFDEAVKKIGDKGIVLSAVSSSGLNELGTPPFNLRSINLLSVKIAYFFPSVFVKDISPYYLFSGVSTDLSSGEKVNVQVLLPTE